MSLTLQSANLYFEVTQWKNISNTASLAPDIALALCCERHERQGKVSLNVNYEKRKGGRRMRRKVSLVALMVMALLLVPIASYSCTTVLVGKAVTADGSVMHAHNEDMGFSAVGRLWSVEAATHKTGEMLEVPYNTISQAEETYQYWASGNTLAATGLGISAEKRPYDSVLVGMNQWGVTMSCNWMNSKEENMPEQGIRRYAIRQLILERAKTARDAVKIIGGFIDKYDQADWGGLGYCLADPDEAWIVETTTHNWVARRVRDDEVLVVANRFTIGKEYEMSSEGLVDFAKQKGWYDPSKGDFSFRDVYGRPDKMNQAYDKDREARTMSLLENKKGLITPEDLFLVLRDRYEGTPKYTKPLQVEIWREVSEGRFIPRTISTNLCQSSSVAHLRSDMPVEVGAVMWYAMVTPHYSGYFPVYAGATTIPEKFSNVNSAYSPDSAWWVFRMLQKVGDPQYDLAYPTVNNFWTANHANIVGKQKDFETRVIDLMNKDNKEEAAKLLNTFTYSQADNTLYHARRLLRLLQDLTKNIPVW